MDTLLEETNPHGTIRAVVEHDGKVIYLYLWGHPSTQFGMRAVWLRNLERAPATLDTAAMERGEPPLMPAAHCRETNRQKLPSKRDLRVVWLPEGNGVGLYEGQRLWAIIPPTSGYGALKGYCTEAVGEGPLAWELPEDHALRTRLKEAERYWAGWEGDFWPTLQKGQLAAYEEALGEPAKLFAIDPKRWPPKAILQIPRDDATVFATVGVAAVPQPNAERATDTPGDVARVELGVVVPRDADEAHGKELMRFVSNQSGYPWLAHTWLGHGHTVPCGLWRDDACRWALLTHEHPAVPEVPLAPVLGDPVNLLWYLPITEAERDRVESEGVAAVLESIPRDRWTKA